MSTIFRAGVIGAFLAILPGGIAWGQQETRLFNGWGMTPAGTIVPLADLQKVIVREGDAPAGNVPVHSDLPLKMVVSPDGKVLLAACAGYNQTGLAVMDLAKKTVTQFFPLPEVFNGLVFSGNRKQVYVSGGDSGKVHAFLYNDGKLKADKTVKPAPKAKNVFLAGMAVHPETGLLYVCNEAGHEVWIVDSKTLARQASIPTGLHPHSCIFGGDSQHLYVSNWGSRSVSLIDTKSEAKLRDIAVGIRPNDMALSPDGRLFVACSGDNTVHVIQTKVLEKVEPGASPKRRPPEGTREILSTALYPASPEGSTPDAVAVSPDGTTLYVANADNNDVLVVDLATPGESRIVGFIPVGWYPSALAVSRDSGTLLVANGKGLRSTRNHPPQIARPVLHGVPFDHPGKILEGSIAVIPKPDAAALARYTQQVKQNSPYKPSAMRRAVTASDCCIPDKVGGDCPIKYVLYIIKENRTYDQVFGDFRDANGRRAGNGDPALVMYGEKVAPNHHQLARDYVLLDNFYCNGEVSVDGHDWCDAGMVTDFKQRSWILSYSRHGNLPGNDETLVPTAGYLWDHCRRHGVTFKCYGEGAARVPKENRGTWPAGRDMDRVDGWIADLHAAEKSGELPQLAIMSLGEDHTAGTSPGKHTPEACVGSNDVGLGKIVEAASKSRFWKEMAIFVVEDDAQNGPDHVDCHRTVALVISPWARRGAVDSTQYTQVGMIRTIELILGLPPMTQYDAAATPMFASFQKQPRATVYRPLRPKVDLKAVNSVLAFGANISARMDFDDYDRADEDQLNRILWRVAKGPDVPYPPILRRAAIGP